MRAFYVVLTTLALTLAGAAPAFASHAGEGWAGELNDKVITFFSLGVLLFFVLVIVLFSFTGSLLPWDANSYLARSREISIASGASVLPDGVSGFIKYVLQGGPLVGPSTLLRFFMAHVFLLPAVMTVLLYVHFRLARWQGPSEPA